MVSLFAGCGGLDLGFRYAGFRSLWANDNNRDACATYRANLGDIQVGDIVELGFPSLGEAPDLLAAGFPCQSFSNAGARRGVHDDNGALYRVALNAVKHFHPRVVVFENVRGLMSAKDGGRLVVERICETLLSLGFTTYVRLVDASHHHVAQRRLRLLIVGIMNNKVEGKFSFPAGHAPHDGLAFGETILDVPDNAPNQNEYRKLNPQAVHIGSMVPEGGSWKDIPYEKLPERLKRIHDNIERYRWPAFYRKYGRNEISGTVTAMMKPENAGVWHPTDSRALSVREAARIQSFPDWFEFHGSSVVSKFRQVGNAVPPRLAYELARQISKVLKGKSPVGIDRFVSLDSFLKRGKPLRPSDPGIEYAGT
jgi:DNA (cytosine-5)-methyltransferase 1